ncbi:MAG TPA: carboxypeptidase regulatory-like domain-containing protein [Blastocatellia bacterium]|nr:carboxypeptidase regulatory-like domain-containing protein [Blastocatellia bacterium]
MKSQPRFQLLLMVMILTLAGAIPVLAEGDGAAITSIEGKVSDSTGKAIVAAQVTVENQATHALFRAVTGDQGGFQIKPVPSGGYSVRVEKQGFSPLVSGAFNVVEGRATTLNSVLSPDVSGDELKGEVKGLQQRVDELESRNRELADQNLAIMQSLKELRARLDGRPQVTNASDTVAAPTGPSPADPRPLGAVQPNTSRGTSVLAAHPASDTRARASAAEPSSEVAAPTQGQDKNGWSLAIGEGNKFQLYGQVRLDMIVDSQRPNNAQSPLFIPSPDPLAGGKPGAGSFTMHPRLTTFGIDYSGPDISALGDAKLSGKLEIDFQNGGAEFQQVVRILQAYFKMDWGDFYLLGGQKWDIFSPTRPIVNDDSVMLATGNVGIRRPQFLAGYEPKVGGGQFSLVAGIGLTGAVDGQSLDGNGFLDGQKSGKPDIQGRIGYSHPLWVKDQPATIGISGVYGFLNTDRPVAGRTTFHEQLVNIDYLLPIASRVDVRGEGWWGRDLSDLVGGIGQGINLFTGQEIRSRGGWSELNFKLSRYYSFNPGFTTDDPVDADIPDGGRTRNHAFYIGNRIMPSQNFLIGIDYLRWRTDFKGFTRGIDNRVNIFFAYHF